MVSPKQRQDARETQKQRLLEIQIENEYINYLLTTDISDLYDDGYRITGETEKDKVVTLAQFKDLRNVLQKPGAQYTKDEVTTLIFCMKLCIESPA